MLSSLISDRALFILIGIFKWRASPLPEPQGMMPKAVSESRSADAISLTVPSPPTARTA